MEINNTGLSSCFRTPLFSSCVLLLNLKPSTRLWYQIQRCICLHGFMCLYYSWLSISSHCNAYPMYWWHLCQVTWYIGFMKLTWLRLHLTTMVIRYKVHLATGNLTLSKLRETRSGQPGRKSANNFLNNWLIHLDRRYWRGAMTQKSNGASLPHR